jgi:hypothetical protein
MGLAIHGQLLLEFKSFHDDLHITSVVAKFLDDKGNLVFETSKGLLEGDTLTISGLSVDVKTLGIKVTG